MLGTPTGIRISHVRRWLDARHELQRNVRETTDGYDSARRNLPPRIAHHDTADEEVEDAAAEEGEHEGGVARDLGRDLEFEEGGCCSMC